MTASIKFYVYVLKHPITQEIRYVGLTNNPKRRFYAHYSTKKKTYTSNWVFSLRKENLKPIMEIVFETDSEETCKQKETELIDFYSKNGAKLTNISCGGEVGIYNSEYLPNNSIITFEEFFKYKKILETENIPILEISQKYNISKQTLYKIASGKLYNHKFGKYEVKRPDNIISNNKKLSGQKIKNTHYSNSKYIIECNLSGDILNIFNSISHLKETKTIGINLHKIFKEYDGVIYKNHIYIPLLEKINKIDLNNYKNIFNNDKKRNNR